VDAVGNVGWFTSIALTAGLGRPRISYYDVTNLDLKYAYRDASGWHTETVDSAGHVGYYTSLALDGSGHPHISYFDATKEDLKHAWRDASGWHTEAADSTGSAGNYTSLALDGSGYPHISYRAGSDNLKYAYRDASGWHTETVEAAGYVGWYTCIALDASDRPHISYQDHFPVNDLKYAYHDGSSWHIETADSAGIVGRFTSLALDAGGRARISYYDDTNDNLKYARAASPIVLTGTLSLGQLVLDWTAVADAANYWVYGADNLAYFVPGVASPYQYRLTTLPSGTTTWPSTNGVGDPAHNWAYLVLAVDATEQVLGLSNRVGEHDFDTGN
jgi:hypothetical protein